jgi:hypothetical protein
MRLLEAIPKLPGNDMCGVSIAEFPGGFMVPNEKGPASLQALDIHGGRGRNRTAEMGIFKTPS